jgi:hypothetical protein
MAPRMIDARARVIKAHLAVEKKLATQARGLASWRKRAVRL